jgi:hypothetical protein
MATIDKLYIGRNPNVVNVNFFLYRDAAQLLDAMAPTRKAKGAYLSRLIYEERVREEERAKIHAQLAEQS